MRNETINIYQFDELSDDAKKKVIENEYDINIGDDWYENVYYDAKTVHIKLTGFDTGRGDYCTGEFIHSATDSADEIAEEHGEHCETFKTAAEFMKDRDNLVYKYSDKKDTERVTEENEYDFDSECDELEDEFLKSILQDYLKILRDDYEYQTSEEAIIETIQCNEYEFTEDGKMY